MKLCPTLMFTHFIIRLYWYLFRIRFVWFHFLVILFLYYSFQNILLFVLDNFDYGIFFICLNILDQVFHFSLHPMSKLNCLMYKLQSVHTHKTILIFIFHLIKEKESVEEKLSIHQIFMQHFKHHLLFCLTISQNQDSILHWYLFRIFMFVVFT